MLVQYINLKTRNSINECSIKKSDNEMKNLFLRLFQLQTHIPHWQPVLQILELKIETSTKRMALGKQRQEIYSLLEKEFNISWNPSKTVCIVKILYCK